MLATEPPVVAATVEEKRRRERADGLNTKRISSEVNAIAPDGSDVRVLCEVERGSMAHFTLPAKATSKAVAHRTVEEIWYLIIVADECGGASPTTKRSLTLAPASPLISRLERISFTAKSASSLVAIGATMPPWPGENEAYEVDGPWQATV